MEKRPEYLSDALEMIGIDLEKPKQIVQEISGFTPLFDCVIQQYHDETRAAVHGAMWRFCQMEDGVCKASLETIASMIGVSAATAMRHAEELTKDGYFTDLTPDLKNKPHIYVDTGKVVMKSKLSAHIAERNVGISQRNASISESQLSKDINKDSNKQAAPPLSSEELNQANAMVGAIIANSGRTDTWEGREIFAPQAYALVDWYHSVTGQTCPKSKRKDWMRAVTMWQANQLTVDHLQAAYDMDVKWRGVFTSPNQLTDKAIALRAHRQARPVEMVELL